MTFRPARFLPIALFLCLLIAPPLAEAAVKKLSPEQTAYMQTVSAALSAEWQRKEGIAHTQAQKHGVRQPAIVYIAFTVAPDGHVVSARIQRSSTRSAAFDRWVTETIKCMQLPVPPSGIDRDLLLPLKFSATARPHGGKLNPEFAAYAQAVHAALRVEWDRNSRGVHILAQHYGVRLPATVEVAFTIAPDGRVASAHIQRSTTRNPKYDRLLAGTIRVMRFPPPPSGTNQGMLLPLRIDKTQ